MNHHLCFATVGRISRRVSLVRYPEPSEHEKDDAYVKKMTERATTSLTNSAIRSSQGTKSRTMALSGYTTSMHTSRDKSLAIGRGEPSKPSKKRQVDDATRSLERSLQDSGRGYSGVTSTGSDDSRQTKSKRPKKSKE